MCHLVRHRDLLHGCLQVEKDGEAEQTKALARVLFDTALLESGFAIEHPKDFNSRVHRILATSLGIKGDLKVAVEPEDPEVPAPSHAGWVHFARDTMCVMLLVLLSVAVTYDLPIQAVQDATATRRGQMVLPGYFMLHQPAFFRTTSFRHARYEICSNSF